ncbi:hypothetical protein J6590_058548, partial [Homalodisca vitripennis]
MFTARHRAASYITTFQTPLNTFAINFLHREPPDPLHRFKSLRGPGDGRGCSKHNPWIREGTHDSYGPLYFVEDSRVNEKT